MRRVLIEREPRKKKLHRRQARSSIIAGRKDTPEKDTGVALRITGNAERRNDINGRA